MPQSVNVTPRPRLPSRRLRSGPKTAAASAETTIASVVAPFGYFDYLTRIAYQAEAAASGYVEFRVYAGGVLQTGDEMICDTQKGSIGNPEEINPPKEIGPGQLIEVRVYNSHASSSFAVECDGTVDAYVDPI